MPGAFVLTGGSRSQLGLLEQAHALGHEVCVVDGSPDAPLFADADYGIVRSFADVGGVLGDLEAQKIEPIAVATMGSEEAEQAFHQLGAPVVVKPVDGSAQRGVTEVRAESELSDAVDRALAASRAD